MQYDMLSDFQEKELKQTHAKKKRKAKLWLIHLGQYITIIRRHTADYNTGRGLWKGFKNLNFWRNQLKSWSYDESKRSLLVTPCLCHVLKIQAESIQQALCCWFFFFFNDSSSAFLMTSLNHHFLEEKHKLISKASISFSKGRMRLLKNRISK